MTQKRQLTPRIDILDAARTGLRDRIKWALRPLPKAPHRGFAAGSRSRPAELPPVKTSVMRVRIAHQTAYRYREAVALGPHRLMLRPRESREVRLVSHEVTLSPKATATEAYDVFGNAVSTCSFEVKAKSLVIDCVTELDHSAEVWPIFDIAASAIYFPFRYTEDEWADLGQLSAHQYPDPTGHLAEWARSFIRSSPTDTLSLLKDLCAGVADRIRYQERDGEGTQAPTETLDRGQGSCRDLATLFTEAVRSLGFGSRIISGYLVTPDTQVGSPAAGTTHAWSEVYLSGAGWIGFDPTNRSVGGKNVIPVAVGRSIRQVMPVVGTFVGPADALEGMSVYVDVAIR